LDVRVFLVEDMVAMRSMVTELLRRVPGFRVTGSAVTEAEARLWLEDHLGGWDLAVVDLVLEQGSGIGVVARCGELPGRGNVVVLSGYATPAVREHCLRLGADAVFDKARPDELLDYCRQLTDRENSGP
jgi:DNA-binding NarL/FixJ family response regulator